MPQTPKTTVSTPPCTPTKSKPSDPLKAKTIQSAEELLLKAQAKEAVGWLHTARFLTTAAQMHHLPAYDLPEIAFVGRSNAGKSTCINVLTQQKKTGFCFKNAG